MVNMKDIILEEKDESNNESNIIHITKHDITVNDRNKDKQFLSHRKRDVRKLKQIFLDLFLPVGYPESLEDPACYINYQFFDSLQALCSYLRGVISTSAMLQAAGVGNSDATALSSAMTWALRDGLGMLGGLIFSYISSPHFDSHVKEFRLFADVINDIGLTLDMLAPYASLLNFSGSTLFVTSLGQLCKVFCGISAGATKSSITLHFSGKTGNMADLQCKESNQETFVTLLGMTVGIYLAKCLQSSDNNDGAVTSTDDSIISSMTWIIFISLTILHVWANYKGVKILRLNTLNQQRLEELLRPFIDSELIHQNKDTEPNNTPLKIASPNEISEDLFESTKKLILSSRIKLGVSIQELLTVDSSSDSKKDKSITNNKKKEDYYLWLIGDIFRDEAYVLNINFFSSPPDKENESLKSKLSRSKYRICVCFKSQASVQDELQAFTHAYLLDSILTMVKSSNNNTTEQSIASISGDTKELIQWTYNIIQKWFGRKTNMKNPSSLLSIDQLSKCGWDCNKRLYINSGKFRFSFKTDEALKKLN